MSRRNPSVRAPAKALQLTETFLMKLAADLPTELRREFKVPALPPGVIPSGAKRSLDSAVPMMNWLNSQSGFCGLGFPGYTYLAELSQRSEYRAPAETIADEMTREWIKLEGADDEKLKELTACMDEFKVRDAFYTMALYDATFGRGNLYIGIKGQESDQRRQLPLLVDPTTIKKDSLRCLKPIEPLWTTPYMYNAIDPTMPDFYVPEAWYVMGKKTNATRLLTFIGHPLPDMLKPAYNFGGMSLSQLIEPYVRRWLKTVDSVNRLVSNYSVRGIKTNMMAQLEGANGDDLTKRAQLFALLADNRGLMMLDKDSEEFFQFNTPLNALPDLQAQAQEHMAAPTHIPLVKLTGITPSGLNASSEGELKVFYDFIKSKQQHFFTDNLKVVLRILQCHLWGAIDENITFQWRKLDAATEVEESEMRFKDAQAAAVYLDPTCPVISPDEQRQRLRNSKHSGYGFLTGDAPEPQKPEVPNANNGQQKRSDKT